MGLDVLETMVMCVIAVGMLAKVCRPADPPSPIP